MSREPEASTGKPIVRATRLIIEFVFGLLVDDWKVADVVGNRPNFGQGTRPHLPRRRLRLFLPENVYPSAE